MKRTLIVFISLVLVVFGVTGCLTHREPKQEYHKNVADLERYIADKLGDYIIITDYSDDVEFGPGAKYRGNMAIWNVLFREQYINDASLTSTAPLNYIIDQVRALYCEYLDNNKDFYLNNYVVKIIFNVPRKHYAYSTKYAVISNWDFENWKPGGTELNTVCMLNLNSKNGSYSFPFGDWNYYYKNGGIDVAQMDETSTMDQIIEVADNIPDLKYIAVKNQAVADEASKLRPNVKFVGLSE